MNPQPNYELPMGARWSHFAPQWASLLGTQSSIYWRLKEGVGLSFNKKKQIHQASSSIWWQQLTGRRSGGSESVAREEVFRTRLGRSVSGVLCTHVSHVPEISQVQGGYRGLPVQCCPLDCQPFLENSPSSFSQWSKYCVLTVSEYTIIWTIG